VVFCGFEDDSSPATFTGATYNGVNMIKIAEENTIEDSNSYVLAAYYILDEDLPTSSGDYTVSVTASSNPNRDLWVSAVSYINVAQTVYDDYDSDKSNSDYGILRSYVDCENDGSLIVQGCGIGEERSFAPSSGTTEVIQDSDTDSSAAVVNEKLNQNTGNQNLGTTPSGSKRRGVWIAACWSPFIEYNYELDLEVQWTSVNYQLPTEVLCIYANTLGTEDIIVDVWDGDSWETVFGDLSTGWNNASVTAWLTSSTFTIRYKGGTETSDLSPDSWQIDAALLKLIDSDVDVFYEGNITSIDITKPAGSNWRIFYADVNNTAYSTFNILDENNNVLLSGLDGNGNSISSVSNDIIRLYGVFDGPIKLDSWNVSINSVGWTSFGINESGGLSWNFNFPEGTGYYYFYSIAKRENWDDESAPSSYDTSCYYNP